MSPLHRVGHDVGVTHGRFAPSPTGDLHLGNLRTALAAWLSARHRGGSFTVRMEDLDRVTSSAEIAQRQLDDLAALGIDWDGDVVFQSARFDRYEAAIARLDGLGLTYPCFCSRREILEAARAPHGGEVPYPGTCRNLTDAERAERSGGGRRPALRLRAHDEHVTFHDAVLGSVSGIVDDVVLRRNDGVPSYNLAVVVDDDAQGIDEVVRGDDLATSTPRQIHLCRLLGLRVPTYAHVPLALGADGQRLAKRHGGVTLADAVMRGRTPAQVRSLLAHSLGLADADKPVDMPELLARFSWGQVPRSPWTVVTNPDGRQHHA